MARLLQFCAAIAVTVGLMHAAHSESKKSEPASTLNSKAPASQVPASSFRLVAEKDTAECLQSCKREFEDCSGGGKVNIAVCTEKRKKCIDSCK